jgi:hypothetical protein
MLERAAETAARLGLEVRLPQPFALEDGAPDLHYRPHDAETLLAQGREDPPTVPYDPARHDPLLTDPVIRVLDETKVAGAGNREFVDRLLSRGLLGTHMKWGLPQLGPSLIPPEMEKVSSCLYPWRESFVEANRVVAPCCNLLRRRPHDGHLRAGRARSARSGTTRRTASPPEPLLGPLLRLAKFCYLCRVRRRGAVGSKETHFKLAVEFERGEPPRRQPPPARARRHHAPCVRKVPAGTRLEIRTADAVLEVVEAEREPEGDDSTFTTTLRPPLVVKGPKDIWLRCTAERKVGVELIGFTE